MGDVNRNAYKQPSSSANSPALTTRSPLSKIWSRTAHRPIGASKLDSPKRTNNHTKSYNITAKDAIKKIFRRKRRPQLHTKRGDIRRRLERLNPHAPARQAHLTLDQLAARKKLEQVRLLTSTYLTLVNSAEEFRVPAHQLFVANLFDWSLYVSSALGYAFIRLVGGHDASWTSCIVMYSGFVYMFNSCVQSYRSFVRIRRGNALLSRNARVREMFLSAHFGCGAAALDIGEPAGRQQQKQQDKSRFDEQDSDCASTKNGMDEQRKRGPRARDSFAWINKIIGFFWPYLSQLIHFKLNEFFEKQIESGSLARSDESLKRLLYAVIRQLDANIIVIERCQLGHIAPTVRNLQVSERAVIGISSHTSLSKMPNGAASDDDDAQSPELARSLVFDLHFEYKGDMNISVLFKYLCCLSSRIGLKDAHVRFRLRAVVGPISDRLPFIESLSFTLLELPDFSFKGVNLAELAEKKLFHNIINRALARHLLYPRHVEVHLSEIIARVLTQATENANSDNNHHTAADRQIGQTGTEQITPDDTVAQHETQQVTLWERLAARLIVFSCVCTNLCMRACLQSQHQADDEDECAQPALKTSPREPTIRTRRKRYRSPGTNPKY